MSPEMRHEELRARVRRSIEQADRGEVAPLDMEEIKAELAAEFNSLASDGSPPNDLRKPASGDNLRVT